MHCTCQDWQQISQNHTELFQNLPVYGWTLTWIELSKENHHHKINNYGIKIKHCPFCGEPLEDAVQDSNIRKRQ
jgi:hypothetical protein